MCKLETSERTLFVTTLITKLPIFDNSSYDARKSSSEVGSHWSDSVLSGRVSFLLDNGDVISVNDAGEEGSKQNQR